MKLICKECESELEFTDLHEDGTEILIKPCKYCIDDVGSNAYDNGFEAGLDDCPCSEEDYQEGYNEAEAYYQEKLDEANDRIKELEDELESKND